MASITLASTTLNRKLACIIILAIGSIVGSDPVNSAIARSNDATLLVADSTTSGGATSTVTPTKHRYWRHRGGKHPHFGSRRVRVPQSGAAAGGGH